MSDGSLSWMLPYKLDTDDREPSFSFMLADAEYGVYMFSIVWWVETLAIFGVMSALAALTGAITYVYIVKKQGTPLSYLLGYGVMMPFWLIVPYYGVEIFDIRNKFMKFCFGAIAPTLGIFHTTEAMYGCVPSYLNTIGAYVHYCGCPMTLQYNHREHKYVKASLLDVASHVKWFFIYLSILGALVSLIRPFRYQPFANFQGQPWHLASRLWNPAQLANNFVLGIIFQAFITTAAEGMIATTVLLTGYKCETVMENPMFTATSPSEFWGKRWNRVIHAALKRGVYIPLRKHQVSQALAAGGAFLASGLFHEWILTFVFQPRTHELGADGSCTAPRCYEAPLGGSTAFFIWNALLISLEYSIGGSKLVVQFVNTVPASLRTVVLVMLALPVAHWFVEPYVVSNFFDQAGIGFPLIKEIAKA